MKKQQIKRQKEKIPISKKNDRFWQYLILDKTSKNKVW